MSNNANQDTKPKVYESKVLLAWETPENTGKIIFPKKNCACRRCPYMDWQVLEDEQEPPTIELVCYCHDRYKETWGRGLPNIPDCDGLYKQPKE